MAAAVNSERRHICSSCGREFSAGLGYCPHCMLSGALAAGAASDAPSCEAALAPPGEPMTLRFEHYELLQTEDGKPVELGRGAMGDHLQGVRRRSALPRDTESHQRKISR